MMTTKIAAFALIVCLACTGKAQERNIDEDSIFKPEIAIPKSYSDIEQLFMLAPVEFEIQASMSDWSSLTETAADSLVNYWLSQRDDDEQIMRINASVIASDAFRVFAEENESKLLPAQRLGINKYLTNQAASKTKMLEIAIAQNDRVEEVMLLAIEKTPPILADKGECDFLHTHSEKAVPSLLKYSMNLDSK